jgi:hypothetical protein
LLRWQTAADNATMGTESKRNRRWFQFSLRTLLIGVTLFCMACAYIGWQVKIVNGRRQTEKWAEFTLRAAFYKFGANWELTHRDETALQRFHEARPPLIRRLLGDSAYSEVAVPYFPPLSKTEPKRIRDAFPGIAFRRH